ncbi:MAG: HAD family phosphatase [Vicingaceae bacterium]
MISLNNYQHIIFDLGNVIININPELTINAFKHLNPDAGLTLHHPVFNDYETGKIDTPSFLDFLSQHFPSASKNELINAWNSLLLDMPITRLQTIKKIKSKGINTYMLSNTNELHFNFILNQLKNLPTELHFKHLFNEVFLSFEMKLRKPQPEIFKKVIEKQQLIPQKTLFIDDAQEHILSAQNLGINTLHLTPDKEITDLF